MMNEIENDVFYDLAEKYDPDPEYHFVGEVDYHLLTDDRPYEGMSSHREALRFVFDRFKAKHEEEEMERAGAGCGGGTEDPWVCDVDRAQAVPLTPQELFYCPNIVRTDYYGNVWYDAEWVPNDENIGTAVPYWYALMEPVHGGKHKPEDFRKVNAVLFPNGTDALDIYEWTTDWADFFDAGHEWYGACCWSIYDRSMDRYAVLLVSATD